MQLPEAFCKRMEQELGGDYAAFLASYDEEPCRGLRVNGRYAEDERVLSLLGQRPDPIPYQEGGYYVRGQVGAHPLHQAGAYYLQDPSAMLTANALDIPRGAKVLDLCAAPGGKSTQLAAMVGDQGLLVANEIDLGRAKTLMGNVERMGLSNTVVCSLPPHKVADLFGAMFDVVVVDAPCSGEGMFRKTPAACDEWSEENVAMCAARQQEILSHAVRLVREGGYLVYSTCTFSHPENEGSVRYLMDEHGFEPVAPSLRVEAATVAGDMPFCRRFYPHLGRGEGHFVAVLRRTTPADVPAKPIARRAPDAATRRTVEQFLQDTLGRLPAGDLCMVGDWICLVPEGAPAPAGALSAGVKIGTVDKTRNGLRLTPHHMYFKCMPLSRRLDLEWDDARVARYLHGDVIEADVPDGWGVLTVEGCPLGGYKAVDGTLKNHYPKGLRQ